jgi:microsomal epoxide hydrolase
VAPRPHRIEVPEAELEDLRRRLAATRWSRPLPGTGWELGAEIAYVRELCEYWWEAYDWRAAEARLNAHPHFLCEIDGVDLHFWHLRGDGEGRLPLLLLHGWPSSAADFHGLIGPLADPAAHGGGPDQAFDLIIPELPGFGFGGRPEERGWHIGRIAAAFDRLMSVELGYDRYGVHGGDWGALTAARIGADFPEHLAGVHLTTLMAPPGADPDPEGNARRERFLATELAYAQLQQTKPDSLTLAQSDSPAGLAAWIVEKFRTWSDCGGDVESAFSRDVLLTNLMFYWAGHSLESAARLYNEGLLDRSELTRLPRIEPPTGVAYFGADPFSAGGPTSEPRTWVEDRVNLTHWTEMPRGGHFPALETPDLLVDDLRKFFLPLAAAAA